MQLMTMTMATARHPVISVFLFFLVTTPLFFLVHFLPSAHAASNLVEGICQQCQNYSFCIQALQSDTRTSAAENNMDLAAIALELGVSNSTHTFNYIDQMYRSPTTDPRQQSALKDCLWAYDGAVSSFKSALSELNVDPLTANYDAMVAGEGAVYCSDFMASAGITDSSISDGNFFTFSLSDIAYVITYYMG